jgi:Protein of unknown function (DUF3306)
MSEAHDFWSRRKAAVEAEEAAVAEDQITPPGEIETHEDRTDAEILANLDLPDPDDLKPGDDVRGFMAQAVPDRLRRRALRQLWKLNPVLANLDGLVDYGEDFTGTATAGEVIATAYQVGKGMLAHVEEMARQAEAAARDEAAPDADQPGFDDQAPQTALMPEPTAEPNVEPAAEQSPPPASQARPASAGTDAASPPDTTAPASRRMRFAFEG